MYRCGVWKFCDNLTPGELISLGRVILESELNLEPCEIILVDVIDIWKVGFTLTGFDEEGKYTIKFLFWDNPFTGILGYSAEFQINKCLKYEFVRKTFSYSEVNADHKFYDYIEFIK